MKTQRSVPTALWRFVCVTSHVLRGLWTIRTQFARLTADQQAALVKDWSQELLSIFGVSLLVRGKLPQVGPALVASNHISWLDIVVLDAAQPLRFVSKSDVKAWPLLGSLITGAGTLYIERENRRDAMRVVHHVAERLQAHDLIGIFPEGTTGDGIELLPFHGNLFQAAIAAQAPVVPVALSFVHASTGERHDAPTYIGDTSLLASMWATLRATDLQAVLHYGEPQLAQGRQRREWAGDVRDDIKALLNPVDRRAS